MKQGLRPAAGPTAVQFYYEKDVTPEEKERFEMLDQVDILAHNMGSKPAYGLMSIAAAYEKWTDENRVQPIQLLFAAPTTPNPSFGKESNQCCLLTYISLSQLFKAQNKNYTLANTHTHSHMQLLFLNLTIKSRRTALIFISGKICLLESALMI